MPCVFEIDHRSFFIGIAIAFGLSTEIWGLTIFMFHPPSKASLVVNGTKCQLDLVAQSQTDLRKVAGVLIGATGGLAEFVVAHLYAFKIIGRKVYGVCCFGFAGAMFIGIVLYLVKNSTWDEFKDDLIIRGVLAVVGFNIIFLIISGIFYIVFLKRSAIPALSVAIIGTNHNEEENAGEGDTTAATHTTVDQSADASAPNNANL